MEPLGRFPRVLNVLKREKIEGPPRDFLKGNQRESKARTKAKNPRGRRPRGFLAFGLAEDVAKGLHLANPDGGLQYSSERKYIEYSRDDTVEAFPQIFILFT